MTPAPIAPPSSAALLTPPATQNSGNPFENFLKNTFVKPVTNTIHQVETSAAVEAPKLAIAKLTGNPIAAKNASTALRQSISVPSPTLLSKGGKVTVNPAFQQYVQNITMGGSDGGIVAPEEEAAQAVKFTSAKANLPNPTTTEQDVANVHQANPLNPPETNPGEPLPSPPEDEKIPQAQQPSGQPTPADLESLYAKGPGESPPPQTEPGDSGGATKIARPSPNPLTAEFPTARPGDFEQPLINRDLFNNHVDETANQAITYINQLSPKDRENFINYVQGVTPIAKAENPELVEQAVNQTRYLFDSTHASDTYAGGKTPYKSNYFPGYYQDKDIRQIDGNGRQAGEVKVTGTTNYSDPTDTHGFRSQQSKFENRQAAINAGEEPLNEDPVDDIIRYAQGAKAVVGSNILKKSVEDADKDSPGVKQNTTLKDGTTVSLSKSGRKAMRGEIDTVLHPATAALKKVNRGIRQALISTGVPHLIIINPARVFTALAALKTPVLDDLRIDDPIQLSNKELGIRIGSPLHSDRLNAGVSNVSKDGSLVKKYNPLTAPKRFVFNWLLPKYHDMLLGAAKDYLDKRGISYDSPEARSVGHQINDVLGYAKNKGGVVNESLFAPALFKSTAHMYAKALTKDGTVARGGVLGQQIFNEGLGYLSKAIANHINASQGQPNKESKDSTADTFWKELVDPSVYTPYSNAKGERIDLGIPGQYQADAARIGLNMKRNAQGHFNFGINSPEQIAANLAQTGKDIASPLVGTGLSTVTNQAFNGQQIRNPYDPLGEQATQTAVNEASNILPINLQGLVNNNLENHLPGFLKSSINLNKNSGPELLRAGGNTLGLNPRADTTTGKGPATTQYFKGQTEGQDYIAAHSNNITTQNDLEGKFNEYFSRMKNDKGQTVQEDGATRLANAKLLQANPVLLKAVQTSEKANGKGNYDPMWDLSDSQLKTFLQYQATPTGYPDRDNLLNQNSWLNGFIQTRDNYYQNAVNQGTSVPAPNTPTYPTFDTPTTNALNTINTIENIPEAQRSAAQVTQLNNLYAQPNVVDAQQAKYAYDNAMQKAEGVSQLQYLSPPDTATAQALATYDALPKGNGPSGGSPDRSAWIKANPTAWASIGNMFANSDLNTIEHQGAIAEFQGATPSNSLLGAIKSEGQYDIASVPLPNGTTQYSVNPTAAYTQSSSSNSSSNNYANSIISEEKQATATRDAEKAAKALKYGLQKSYTHVKPYRNSIPGVHKVTAYKVKKAGVGNRAVPKIALKAAPSGNKIRLKV